MTDSHRPEQSVDEGSGTDTALAQGQPAADAGQQTPSAEAADVQGKAEEAKAAEEPKAAEAKAAGSAETKPAETKPAEAKAAEVTTSETGPAEPKAEAAGTKVEETKAAETKAEAAAEPKAAAEPAETKAAEPAEAKPATAAAEPKATAEPVETKAAETAGTKAAGTVGSETKKAAAGSKSSKKDLLVGAAGGVVVALAIMALLAFVWPGFMSGPGKPDDQASAAASALANKDSGALEAVSCHGPDGKAVAQMPPQALQLIKTATQTGPAHLSLDTQARVPIDLTLSAQGQTQKLPVDLVLGVTHGQWCMDGISQQLPK